MCTKCVLCLAVLGLLLLDPVLAQHRVQIDEAWAFPEARQFDFWIGEWEVKNRFLQDDGTWADDGQAHVKIFPILGGKAILEFWDGDIRGGYVLRGYSLRYFDRERGQWQLSLNWPGPNRPGFSELAGTFRHGRGEFFTRRTTPEGQESLTRYTFSDVTPTSLRWDDGVSMDGGRTWRENWIMEFTRIAEVPTWPAPGEPFHTFATGERCTEDEAKRFDVLEGRWKGTVGYDRNGTSQQSPARMEAYRVLDGCATFTITEYVIGDVPRLHFEIRSFIPDREVWVELQLDDHPGTGFRYRTGAFDVEDGVLEMTGFVPEWAKGPKPDVLTKTTWHEIGPARIRYDVAESADDGQTWTQTYAVELEKH